MPSLPDTLRSSSPIGYAPMVAPTPALPPVMPNKGNFGANPSIRCPLPPFNVNSDTLRQFDQSEGTSPRRRVVPLPIQTMVGSGSTVINKTTVTSSGSGGGSTATLTAKTVTLTSPLLAPGSYSAQVLTMAKSYQLIAMSANSACELRLYGSANSQAIDVGRATDSPLPAELFNNIVTDVVMDTSPFLWEWQNRVGVNTDIPQGTSVYATVFNIGMNPISVQLTVVFLPLES